MCIPDTENRRHNPRREAQHEVCLQANLSLLDAQVSVSQGNTQPLTIFGSTHDLSEAGVSLIVPLVPIDERYCAEEGQTLPLTLYLPSGQVHMQVTPIRCGPLDQQEPGKGFFMGAQIAAMDNGERARFLEYLRTSS